MGEIAECEDNVAPVVPDGAGGAGYVPCPEEGGGREGVVCCERGGRVRGGEADGEGGWFH